MRRLLLLAGPDITTLVGLTSALDNVSWSPYILQSDRPVERLLRRPVDSADVAIVELTGRENISDVAPFCDAHPRARFIFLIQAFPPRAPLARIVAENRGVILRRTEPPVVIAATLVTLFSGEIAVS